MRLLLEIWKLKTLIARIVMSLLFQCKLPILLLLIQLSIIFLGIIVLYYSLINLELLLKILHSKIVMQNIQDLY